ncbi:MAG: nucleoside diphosphate kinase regulator [Acetobacteraceae bacterium]|nr:nucleoside diphosphate kinase regulator [Acetobacteraceae bacterium]
MLTEASRAIGKPRIVVSEIDHRRLSDLATGALSKFPDVAEALAYEMDRAEVVAAGAVPQNVVQMGSVVEFRTEAGQQRRITLVYPPEADISANRISILTPIGTALIGLAPGQSIRFATYDGREHALSVLGVEPPAESDAD